MINMALLLTDNRFINENKKSLTILFIYTSFIYYSKTISQTQLSTIFLQNHFHAKNYSATECRISGG
jgi:hypothetical protein